MILGSRVGEQASANKGQRLHCQKCGAEVEIVTPCTCNPSALELRCCGAEMVPSVASEVQTNAE
jgi:hypothetical protein